MLLLYKISILILLLQNTNSQVNIPTENRFLSPWLNSIATNVGSFFQNIFRKPTISMNPSQPVQQTKSPPKTKPPFEIITSKSPFEMIPPKTPFETRTSKTPFEMITSKPSSNKIISKTANPSNNRQKSDTSSNESSVLIELLPDASTSKIKTCKEKKIKSCIVARVNSLALDSPKFSIPHCKDMVMKDVVDPSFKRDTSTSIAFTNKEGCEAMLQFSDGELMGNIEINGYNFYIEACRAFKGCYVWKEQDTKVFKDHDRPIYLKAPPIFDMWQFTLSGNMKKRIIRGEKRIIRGDEYIHPNIIVGYSVKFYYTKKFRNIMISGGRKKILNYFKLIVAETNQGYKNSKIPVKMQIHCIEYMPYIRETSDPKRMLETFKGDQRRVQKLRGSADVAVLIVSSMGNGGCGMGYVDSWRSGVTLSVVDYSCARGYYSLGHEVAHNFGCVHDRAHEYAQPSYAYAYGYHISRGPYRTVMAYDGPRHHDRVNIYSSPRARYKGMVTGNKYSNCARVILENRIALSRLGNERTKCRWYM